MRERIPRLSKTRFLSGLQCHKRLWLELYAPELGEEPDPTAQQRFETGTAVGELARERFPGGVLVAHDHRHHAEAEALTGSLIADGSVPAIYEAALSHDDVAVRADVLVQCGPGEFDLIEVKSTASAKDVHRPDLAVQLQVLEGAGLRVRRAYLMHLDTDYVYEGGAYDLERLFRCVDLTDEVRALQGEVAAALHSIRASLWGEEPPPVGVGPQCTAPYPCPFYDHCHVDRPKHPIEELPRCTEKLIARLAALGIADIRAIPGDFEGLSLLQARARDALQGGTRYHDPAIADVLAGARFPVNFLDFETFAPALPLFAGTHPYQTIPFQWSNHTLFEDGQMVHREFLHAGRGDPRREFAEALLDATGEQGSIVVYSGFEAARLRELEAALPELAPRLEQVRSRLFDILPVIRSHVYDPAFRGSFSIKKVLPALVRHLDYDDLEIADGLMASAAYEEMRDTVRSAERAAELRANLLAYCKRDTEAMVELFRALR